MTRAPLLRGLSHIRPDAWTAPFWDAASKHVLVCQVCAVCGSPRMPPAPFCWSCQSQEHEWRTLPGTGTVYAYTTITYSTVPEITADDLPYSVVLVDLDSADGARLLGVLVADAAATDGGSCATGDRVRVVWDDVEPGVTIPRFELEPP